MLLSVEQAFVGSECNPISPKNDCVGGYCFEGVQFSVQDHSSAEVQFPVKYHF